MFTYKWSMIQNDNTYNFLSYIIMFVSLLVNVYTLDLASYMKVMDDCLDGDEDSCEKASIF